MRVFLGYDYKAIWKYAEEHMQGKLSCKYIVNCLYLAAVYDCEAALADNMMVVAAISRLVHHTTIINLQEVSYKKKHASNAGGLK